MKYFKFVYKLSKLYKQYLILNGKEQNFYDNYNLWILWAMKFFVLTIIRNCILNIVNVSKIPDEL